MQEIIAPAATAERKVLRFVLPAIMTLETAEAVAAEMVLLPLNADTDVVLESAQVMHITSAGVQIITALAKTVAEFGGTLTYHEPHKNFVQTFKDIGLERLLPNVS